MTTSLTGAESRVCGRCQRPIDQHAPDGLCVACLVESALEMDSSKPVFSRTTDGPDKGPSAGAVPAFFGDFELIEEVGRGGMGVVWKARQRDLGRIVALKLLSAGPFSTPEFRERFRREAATASRLQHPGIVTVFQTGELDGHAWLAMEFVSGRTPAELVREQPVHPREAAKLVQAVATAIEHSRRCGVLHRDLKPSNILIAPAANRA
jgi:serine/threonine-protein kinase